MAQSTSGSAGPLCIGGMATMPSRAHTLKAALASVLPQVDRLYLYLDRHAQVPEALKHLPKVVPLLPADYPGLMGDGKFLGACLHDEPCRYFTFDDDILYPPTHVPVLGQALARYGDRALVGMHGSVFFPPYESYRAHRGILHFSAASKLDCLVDEVGSGTAAFHTGVMDFDARGWAHHHMGDLNLAIEAVRRGLPRILVRRPQGFLKALEENQADSLWMSLQADDSCETAVLAQAFRDWPDAWQRITP